MYLDPRSVVSAASRELLSNSATRRWRFDLCDTQAEG